jgi:hypothetical protein
MKTMLILLAAVGFNLFISCSKDNTSPSSGSSTGKVCFWSDVTTRYDGSMSVYVDGNYVGGYDVYFNNTPDCGSSQTLNVILTKGTHTYSATSTGGHTWSGSFNVASDCTTFDLHL